MYKIKRLLATSLAFILVFSLLPTIKAHASSTPSVDLVVSNSSVDVNSVHNGISYTKTGYLCYLLTEDGNAVKGTSAKAFKSPGFSYWTDVPCVFKANTRRGDYPTVTGWTGTAPWGCTPFNGDRTSNGEQIRSWMKSEYSSGISNGSRFVSSVWGTTAMQKFESGDYILVIETLLHYQNTFQYTYNTAKTQKEWETFIKSKLTTYYPDSVIRSWASWYVQEAQEGTTYHAPFGNSIVGTVSDCLKYKDVSMYSAMLKNSFISINTNVNWFKKYTNMTACYAEMIGANGAGKRAGFLPWTRGTSDFLTDDQVKAHGVGMLVISSKYDDLVTADTPSDDPPSTYDGTIYTLTSAGGSQSSGGSIGSFAGGSASRVHRG